MISVDEAFSHLTTHALTGAAQVVSISDANGRILAADVTATINKPALPLSAMDGYAVRINDVAAPGATLRVVGEVRAGTVSDHRLGPGEAMRIFTGAPLPDGADHILIQEDVARDGDHIRYDEAANTPRFIRAAGKDFRQGDILIDAGTRLTPRHVALIAAANIAAVSVQTAPTVCLLSNGDELRAPGGDLAAHETIDALTPALTALFEGWGCRVSAIGPLPDDRAAIDAALDKIDADLILPIGGASVGDYDHMQSAFAAQGFDPIFSKVAVRPGKPSWLSRREGQRVLGLPGNPVSAMICAQLFASTLIFGRSPIFHPMVLASDLPEEGPREHFRRVQVTEAGVVPAKDQDSSLLSVLARSDGIVRRRSGASALAAGSVAQVLLF